MPDLNIVMNASHKNAHEQAINAVRNARNNARMTWSKDNMNSHMRRSIQTQDDEEPCADKDSSAGMPDLVECQDNSSYEDSIPDHMEQTIEKVHLVDYINSKKHTKKWNRTVGNSKSRWRFKNYISSYKIRSKRQ